MTDNNITQSASNDISNTSISTNLSVSTSGSQESGPSVIDYVNYVFLPATVTIGITGNILTIIVMKSRQFSTVPSSYLLICLAVSDSVLLLTQPLNKDFVIDLIGQDIRALHNSTCKLYFIIRRASKMTSSWFVVGLCFERFIAVWFPLKAKFYITKRTLLAGILAIYAIIFAFTGAYSYASEIVKGICQPDVYDAKDPAARQRFGAMLRTASSLYSIVPMIILLTLTPLIIAKLVRHNQRRKIMKPQSSTAQRSKDDRRVTAMLIGIVLAYIILVLPITVLHNAAYELKISAFASNDAGFNLFKEISQLLEQLNYALNFFLYVMTSRHFRSVLWDKLTSKPFHFSEIGNEKQ
ncbi:neuromedin-U receptor 2-like [Saccostrea echinata]|uniref:neuromedin-U receptor 2-like n=1 Tax=Saccostrea echinata TaxID=191078 RepID=UPI002A7F463E|nr:neuromedin-U receptor 2-like [Saccostrea echinata]XP_061178404.1 neuromedin-U receptor 2-like [Saccostrea echinata]